MGKKGKGNKLAKMSEEERARYLQMRADIEEEARRRKIQLITLYMKNKLKREEAFCRLNMAKINQEWRSILRQMKCQELQQEMIEVEKFFKVALERKNRIIKRLLNDLDVAEDMYGTLQQAHMGTINKLISIQRQRIEFFQRRYEEEKQSVLQEHEANFADFRQMRQRAQEELECVMYQLEDKGEKEMQQRHEDYLTKLDDLKSEMHIRLETITNSGEEKLQSLWQEYQDVLAGYVQHTESFYAEYVDLKERDEESTAQIRDHCYEIEKSADQLAHLKLVASDVEERSTIKLSYLQRIRNELSERLSALKLNVDAEIARNEERFKLMSVESHYALKAVDKIVANGETLLQLANVCRKFETEREKILPLGLSTPLPRLMFEPSEQPPQDPPLELRNMLWGNWLAMENFWLRVNSATIDVACLKRQKRSLQDENARLKAALQDHLIQLNISNGTNTHINDYLAKRPSSMRVDRVAHIALNDQPKSQSADALHRRRRRPVTSYVEANFTNAVRSRELTKGLPTLATIVTTVRGGSRGGRGGQRYCGSQLTFK